MSFTVTISNPSYIYTGGVSGKSATDVPVKVAGFNMSFNAVSEWTLMIEANVSSLYYSETNDSTNVVQLNSTVVISDTYGTWFTGTITEKPKYENFADGRYLQVVVKGVENALVNALVTDANGNRVWTLETSKHALTNMPLQATSAWGTLQGSTLWPDPDDATGLKCYTAGASDVLYTDGVGTVLSAVATTIILTTTYKAFVPRGWIKIDSEWIYFDGYDNSNADTRYRLFNCVRGQLGTSAATHAEGSTVYEKLGKEIAPAIYEVENDPGTGYVPLRRPNDYEIMAKVGAFVLNKVAAGTYRASYSVYDEDASLNGASVAISLKTVIKQIAETPVAYGGAGFAAGDEDFDATTGLIKVNRYDYDPAEKPKYAWEAIMDLIQTVGLTQEVGFWYKHSTSKLRLTVLANDTASFTIPHVESIEAEQTLDDVYSAIEVEYTDDQDLNRACATYGYHQAATGVTTSPDHYTSCATGGESWQIPSPTNNDAAGSGGIALCTDGKPGSKLVAVYTHDPGGDCEHSQYYFGATAPAITLSRIKLIVGNYRVIDAAWQDALNTDKTWVVHLEGCTDYNTGTHSGTWLDLGCYMECKPSPEGTFIEHTFNIFAERRVNAVRVIWDYMPGPKTAHGHWAPLHDIEIIGDQVKYALVQLSDTEKGKSAYLYAPASYEKLRGGVKASSGTGGSQRSWNYPIGASSHAAAVSLGRIVLTTHLARWNQRRYAYDGAIPGIPELGITINCTESTGVTYTGVIRELAGTLTATGVQLTGTVLDSTATVLT